MKATIEQILTILEQKNIKEFEIDISKSIGVSSAVRLGKLENTSQYQNQDFDITIYQNGRSANASSVDISIPSIKNTIDSAIQIAKYTQIDKFNSLAPKDRLAFNCPDLKMFHPWDLSANTALDIALECENAGLEFNTGNKNNKISNSDGCEVSSFSGQSWYVNSTGLSATRKSSSHSISCSLLAKSDKDTQTGYEYKYVLDKNDFGSFADIGKKAAQNTIKKLNGSLIKSGNYPVIFTNKVSSSIISSILGGLSGSAQYKKSTFLEDSLGKIIMPENINILENPLQIKTIGAKAYDDDGVLKQKQYFVQNGVVQSYIMGQYSANQMQMQSTGNSGGVNNIIVNWTKNIKLDGVIKTMGDGIIIDELMGQGINGITGDYSRGAAGFLVKNGEITQRISGITIAGNLKQMMRDIEIIAKDFDKQKNIKVGSILIKNMMVAGE